MTAPALQHRDTCAGLRVEQTARVLAEEQVEVTTWRCLDCAAVSSTSRPLTEDEQDDSPSD